MLSGKIIAVLANSIAIGTIPATPCLTIIAFRRWPERPRNELPRWRNLLGLTSIVTTFLSWLVYIIFFLLVGFTRIHPNEMIWLISELVLLGLGVLLALALKSPSRPLTLFAGALMILLLWASVNF